MLLKRYQESSRNPTGYGLARGMPVQPPTNRRLLFWLGHLISDDAAHGCTTQCAQRATSQHCTTNCTSACANGRSFFLRRHARATPQAKQQNGN